MITDDTDFKWNAQNVNDPARGVGIASDATQHQTMQKLTEFKSKPTYSLIQVRTLVDEENNCKEINSIRSSVLVTYAR